MSLTQEDVQKLASLSRMKLSEEELAQFTKEIDSILGYVQQINEVSASAGGAHGTKKPEDIPHRNILREDVADRELLADGEGLVSAAPQSQDNLVKVKKILN
jgi:aspartyl-tRNA(Asn)/glutamyl-tRNA(Gln) amidotransferase subunit C